MQNYGIKITIDALSKENITINDLFQALLFISGAELMLATIWRISWLGYLKSIPNITNDFINKYYDIIQSADHEFFKEHSTHIIISKLRGLSEKFREIFDIVVYKGIHNFSTMIVSLTSIIWINSKLALLVLGWCLIFITYKILIGRIVVKISFKYYQSFNMIFSLIGDKIANIKNIIQFSKIEHEKESLNRYLSTTFFSRITRKIKIETLDDLLSMFIYGCFISIGLVLIFKLKRGGKISVSEAVFVLTNIMLFSETIWKIVFDIKDTVRLLSEVRSSSTILKEANLHIKRRDSYKNKSKNITKGEINFRNMGLCYGKKSIIENLNLSIKAGEKIGITGKSGAGKTTIIKLLTNEISSSSGEILIDGENINNFSEADIMDSISIISQDVVFFHRSIFDNIAYGSKNKPTNEEVYRAAKIANIHEEILNLPSGYETIISQHNHKISTGQKQRIAIARAVLKNSKILILDEATSHLDYYSEKLVQDGIDSLVRETNQTVIIIAHRLKIIKHVDRIIVLENGKIAEEGSFDKLMEEKGLFYTIYQSQ